MSQLDRDQVLARLRQLPSLPSAVSGVLASFANEDMDVEVIAAQISRDQGLTARVLRVANSSFYGLQTRVGTINEAVVVLGFRAVRSMVLAVGMNGAFRVDQCAGFDAGGYLRHGVGVALASRRLARGFGQHADLAFTGGLLHDIGMLVLASAFPKQYGEVLAQRRRDDRFLIEVEREILGIDHAEVGGMLAQTWHFPVSLFEAVAHHHDPAAAPAGSLANVVHVADATAHALGLSRAADEMVMPVAEGAWASFGGDAGAYGEALAKIEAEFEDVCQALAV